MITRRMWEGGPLRQWSDKSEGGNWVKYESPILTGYAGCYVCDQCRMPCDGVYHQRRGQMWVCGACRKAARPRQTVKVAVGA